MSKSSEQVFINSKKDSGKNTADTNGESVFINPAKKNDNTKKPMNPKLAEMKSIFDSLDTDKSGFIERSEFKKLLKESGFTDKQADDMIQRTDNDKDGKINFKEFCDRFDIC